VQPEGADGDLEGLEGFSGDLGLHVRRLRRVHRQRPAPPRGGARLLRRHGHVVARLQVGPQLPHGFREVPIRHLLSCRGGGARGAHGSSQRLNQPVWGDGECASQFGGRPDGPWRVGLLHRRKLTELQKRSYLG
jgi:hypothetical protein